MTVLIQRRRAVRESAGRREARRQNALAVARREQPGADRYVATFYEDSVLVEVWRDKKARMFQVVGEEL
ncbi:MAG: hypothetical protein ACRD2Z_03250 [Thermoanaerobaculia bacterium]